MEKARKGYSANDQKETILTDMGNMIRGRQGRRSEYMDGDGQGDMCTRKCRKMA